MPRLEISDDLKTHVERNLNVGLNRCRHRLHHVLEEHLHTPDCFGVSRALEVERDALLAQRPSFRLVEADAQIQCRHEVSRAAANIFSFAFVRLVERRVALC